MESDATHYFERYNFPLEVKRETIHFAFVFNPNFTPPLKDVSDEMIKGRSASPGSVGVSDGCSLSDSSAIIKFHALMLKHV